MKIQKAAIAGIVVVMAGAANADVARIGEFDSLQFEGFDNERWVFERDAQEVFGGLGEVVGKDSWIHTTGSWGLSNGDWRGSTRAYDGNMLGNTRGSIVYNFNEAQHSFGGFFATIADVADGSIKFFDSDDELVGQSTIAAAVGGEWSWNGWALEEGFTKIEVTSNYNNGAGGFLMQDSLRLSTATIPAPGAIALLLTGGLMSKRRRTL
jgi:hypothetical protein